MDLAYKFLPRDVLDGIYAGPIAACARLAEEFPEEAEFLPEDTEHSFYNFDPAQAEAILLDVAPIQKLFAALIDHQGIDALIAENSKRKPHMLPEKVSDSSGFAKAFMLEATAHDPHPVRRIEMHSQTKAEYGVARANAKLNPVMAVTLAVMEDVVRGHLQIMSDYLDGTLQIKGGGFRGGEDIANIAQQLIGNSNASFRMELLPVLTLSASPALKDAGLRDAFREGLQSAYAGGVFESVKGVKSIVCPFKSRIGRLWNTDLVPDESGKLTPSPTPRPAALPTLIAQHVVAYRVRCGLEKSEPSPKL